MTIKTIIFDMDGVLFHTSKIHALAFSQILNEMGIAKFDYSEIAGMKTQEATRFLLNKNHLTYDEEQISLLSRKKSQISLDLFKNSPPVDPYSFELLKKLFKKYKLILASSASQTSVDLFLAASKTKSFFSFILSSDSVRFTKPHPEIYLKALELSKTPPHEALVIEDSTNGIKAATQAHIQVIGILGTTNSEILLAAGAKKTVSSLQELEKILDLEYEPNLNT